MNFNFNGSREIEHVRDMHMDFASRSMKLDLNILHKIEMSILYDYGDEEKGRREGTYKVMLE